MLHTDNKSVLICSIHFLLYQVLLSLVSIHCNLQVQQELLFGIGALPIILY
jgi:hypothetical protein